MRSFIILLLFSFNFAYADARNPWADVSAPIRGSDLRTEAIGTYASGCLRNGIEVPVSNRLWELVNIQRHRNYAHPRLISFLIRLGAWSVDRAQLGKIVVGDIAMPAGGPLPYGHTSHQIGLDVDIRFSFAPSSRRMRDRVRYDYPEIPVAVHKVVEESGKPVMKKEILRDAWLPAYGEMLETAASYSDVERVFVSPPIKQELCNRFKPAVASDPYPLWLRKVQPYFGHTEHFHVRLRCPKDSLKCIPQGAVAVSPLDPTRVGCAGPLLGYWLDDQPKDSNFMAQGVARIKRALIPIPPVTPAPTTPPATPPTKPDAVVPPITPVAPSAPSEEDKHSELDLDEDSFETGLIEVAYRSGSRKKRPKRPARAATPPVQLGTGTPAAPGKSPTNPPAPVPTTKPTLPPRPSRADFLPAACKELIKSVAPTNPL